jgi:hypothetical protein
MFGVHVGINIDVPIYKKLYLMTSFMYRYLFIHHQNKAGDIEFSLGLGYLVD